MTVLILDRGTVEKLLFAAIKTLDVARDPDRRFVAPVEHLREFFEGYDNEAARAKLERAARYQPSRIDHDRMLPVLAWIPTDLKPRYWLLRARAYGFSFYAIAGKHGRSEAHWRRLYGQALDRIEARARAADLPDQKKCLTA